MIRCKVCKEIEVELFGYKMENIIALPRHKPPILHENASIMSFENCYFLGATYKEIIGLFGIDHFSINVVDKNGRMSILSYNPQIAYNIFKDGTYLYNGSISPTYYNSLDMYSWDETYDPKYYNVLKNTMERKNRINKGIVLTKDIGEYKVLFSFATKGDPVDFESNIKINKGVFLSAGLHCFDQIKGIIQHYINDENKTKKTNNIIRFPNNGRD